ncbi:hypothetical protein G039_0304860 [Pseudomonas aeruginosa VRFPA01]|nr:hypothetical protein G039_0304860 [Pseudomonas aeruginosa VRFPA01]
MTEPLQRFSRLSGMMPASVVRRILMVLPGARVRFLVKDDWLFMCGTLIDQGYKQGLPFPSHPFPEPAG